MASAKDDAVKNASEQITQDDHINWRYQDRTYNEAYKSWRRKKKDSIGFFYVTKPNELTYRDGFGFVKDYPEVAETNTLRNVCSIVGVAMLIYALFDIMYIYVVPFLFNRLGFDIYLDFYSNELYGNGWLIFGLKFFFEISKRAIPFLLLWKTVQMPIKIMLPTKITNRHLFRASVPMMLLVCGICSIATMIFSGVLSLASVKPVAWMQLPDDPLPAAATLILEIVLVPVLSEILGRGVIMQLLRQFGDGSAILFSAFITAAVSYNIGNACYLFISAVVIGYFTVRTGSVTTAVIMRIASTAFGYALFYIDKSAPTEYRYVMIFAYLLVFIMTGLIVTITFIMKHSDKLGMSIHSRYLTFSQKFMTCITSAPVVIWITTTVVIYLLHINFVS